MKLNLTTRISKDHEEIIVKELEIVKKQAPTLYQYLVETKQNATVLQGSCEAYVDGSFNIKKSIVGYAAIITAANLATPQELSGNSSDALYTPFRNVAGEILASLTAAHHAIENGYKEIIINYDYTGIEAWVTGAWKAKNELTQNYKAEMQSLMKSGLIITFQKVKAHSGISGNEKADKLAKAAAGI